MICAMDTLKRSVRALALLSGEPDGELAAQGFKRIAVAPATASPEAIKPMQIGGPA